MRLPQTNEIILRLSRRGYINKKRLVWLLLVAIILCVFYWLYSHAFITIAVDNAQGKDFKVSLVTHGRSETIQVSNNSNKIKRLVSRGDYEIMVQQNENSFFSISKIGGFLGTTTVQGKLQAEKGRKFVGDEPAECTQYTGQILLSYECGGPFSEVRVHEPSTSERPTYPLNNPTQNISGNVGGIIKTPEGQLVLIHNTEPGEETGPPQSIHVLNDDLSLKTSRDLTDLAPAKIYSITPYKSGFVAYDSSLSEAFYYSSLQAKPLKIPIDPSNTKGYVPYLLDAGDEGIAVTYANGRDEAVDIDEPEAVNKGKSEVVVNENGKLRHFNFKRFFVSVKVCGKQKLCVLGNKQLDVYDISGKKQKLLYSMNGVLSIANSTAELLIVRDKDVLTFNITKRDGFRNYSMDEYYSYCGMQTDNDYTLCLINSKQKKIALHISQEASNGDTIDKKVAELLKYAEVSDISVYDKYIHIIPNYGPSLFDETTGSYTPDPVAVKRVNDILDKAIAKLGINKGGYNVIR